MVTDKNDLELINYASILQEILPFSYLSIEVLNQLIPNIERKIFPVDSYIFRQGDESKKTLFIIVSGLAEISVRNNKGDSFVLDYRNRGSFFGETVVLSNKSYVATLKCLTELDCLLIKSEDIELLIETNGIFANHFNMIVADHFYNLINKIPTEQGIMKGLITYENQGAQKRASELMNSPVITCNPTDKIDQVAKKMGTHHVSSIVIINNEGKVSGSITEKDLVENVIAKNLSPEKHCASEIATKKPLCISPDSFYYQILLAMTKEKVKHAIVTENNSPIGIITIRDLTRARNNGVISVIDRLETQSNLNDLALVGQEIEQVLNGLMMEKAPIPEILDIITEFYDRVTKQVIDLSIEKMKPEFGPPPVKFCWLTMGSSGRREQFLRTDQDNALIYETTSDTTLSKNIEIYFKHFANIVNDGLVTCGFAPCPGNVMASNPIWRGDTSYWNTQVSTWVNILENVNIRFLTIFLDFRPVYGYFPLAEELRDHTNKNFASLPLALNFLAHDATQGRLPLSIFGNPIGGHSKERKHEIDIKTSISVYLVDCIRLLAISKNSDLTNTLERIHFLKEKRALSNGLADSLDLAFHNIMKFRISTNLDKLKSGKDLDNYINLTTLNQNQKLELKESLKAIETLIAIVREDFIHD